MRHILPVILTLILVAGIGCFARPGGDGSAPSGQGPLRAPENMRVEDLFGVIAQVDGQAGLIRLRLPEASEEIAFDPADVDADHTGLLARVSGARDPATRRITAESLEVVDDPGLFVTSPSAGATVTSPLVVFGYGRTPDGAVSWRIRDADDRILGEGSGRTDVADIGHYGPFRFEIVLPALEGREFTLEIFWNSPRDGSERDAVSVPLKLLFDETTAFEAFFSTVSATDCEGVEGHAREVAKTGAAARAALATLLEGPTSEERVAGAVTHLPRFTQLRSVSIQAGRATADFSAQLRAVAGPCARRAAREQIVRTLRQFDSVHEVDILIEGQPAPEFSLD